VEYASVAWNSVTITDSNKLERIQRQFAALCQNRCSQDIQYQYDSLLEKLNLLTVHIGRRHSDAVFLMNVFNGAKCRPSRLETVAFVFPLGTYLTLPYSVAPPATALQLDMFLLQISLETQV
jgi:hypothetical protein